ncbi:unnamed protein product, partial [marine sediment metagenome]
GCQPDEKADQKDQADVDSAQDHGDQGDLR